MITSKDRENIFENILQHIHDKNSSKLGIEGTFLNLSLPKRKQTYS